MIAIDRVPDVSFRVDPDEIAAYDIESEYNGLRSGFEFFVRVVIRGGVEMNLGPFDEETAQDVIEELDAKTGENRDKQVLNG